MYNDRLWDNMINASCTNKGQATYSDDLLEQVYVDEAVDIDQAAMALKEGCSWRTGRRFG
jgi:hypothetical protein